MQGRASGYKEEVAVVIEEGHHRRRKKRRKQFFARTLLTARFQRRFMRSVGCDFSKSAAGCTGA